ncbi:MAG TPA: FAD-binding oxidoreductase [Dehalococcoidia bacterium]|nr:FAD-binding oxidoreductase [Dehalococcoidia bacterium]
MTATASKVERRLRDELSALQLAPDTAAYEVDGVRPSVAVSPTSAAEVSKVLATADAVGAAVVPWGGGAHMALGMPPKRYDLALDLSRLGQVIEYEPADLTVTVEAGLPLAGLQAILAQHSQWLPLDPPAPASATVGGVLAANASGPARIAFGTARDLVIGMTVALADGRVVKSGGRVVKNVAGYDMAKAHIGALGTLGVILQVSFKVAPLPKAVQTLSVASGDVAALARAAFAVRDAALPATGIAVLQAAGASEARLLLRFAGNPAAVDRSTAETLRLARSAGLEAEQAPEAVWAEAGSIRGLETGAVLKVSHLPSHAAGVLSRLEETGADVVAYPTAGISYARFLALPETSYELVRRLRKSIEAQGGALVLESAPVEAKTAIDVWGSPRGDFELMRRLRQEMDPKSTLNPGRFLEGL